MSNPNPPNQFQPGHPPLSNGRPPKDWTMASLIREAGDEADETGVPRSRIIARKLADLASKGDMQAIKEFNNRLDGMPKQTIENEGDVKFIIEVVQDNKLLDANTKD